jgi:glycosyltransferase involved in cell wall biosynthesis
MTISIILPFYNEENCVNLFFAELLPILNSIQQYKFELICINDGSTDKTLDQLLAVKAPGCEIKIIDLSRNFGKEAAITAGLDYARGDAIIFMDTDLQDPPSLIPEMITEWRSGNDVVLAKRSDRSSDTFLKRNTAKIFYKLNNAVADVEIPNNVGDYRLIDSKVAAALKKLPERRRFMKGLFAWVGFKTTSIEYQRPKRTAGKTKFNCWKLWNFAIEGITSFSTLPLRVWTYIGISIALIAFLYAVYIIIRTVFHGIDVPGYASLFTAILFLGGIQLMGIGILGEYIGRIYYEAKQRPIYIVRKFYPPMHHNLNSTRDELSIAQK